VESFVNLRSFTPAADEIVRHSRVDAPDVSVVIAVRDGERFLEKAIRSILSQSLRNLELILVDDGSSDRTPEIIDRFGDTRMRTLTQPERGIANALNRGFSIARAPFVGLLDPSDVAVQNRLERQLDFMRQNPGVGLLGTGATLIDEPGQEISRWTPVTGDKDLHSALIRENQFDHSSVMVRKSIFSAVGGYSNMPFAYDYDLYLRLSRKCKLANLPEPLNLRRVIRGGDAKLADQQYQWVTRAKIGAVKRGDYSPLAARHIIKPAIALFTPGPVRDLARRASGHKAA
jgi:glycosyltransferase involved in cell wall biosynthesis